MNVLFEMFCNIILGCFFVWICKYFFCIIIFYYIVYIEEGCFVIDMCGLLYVVGDNNDGIFFF